MSEEKIEQTVHLKKFLKAFDEAEKVFHLFQRAVHFLYNNLPNSESIIIAEPSSGQLVKMSHGEVMALGPMVQGYTLTNTVLMQAFLLETYLYNMCQKADPGTKVDLTWFNQNLIEVITGVKYFDVRYGPHIERLFHMRDVNLRHAEFDISDGVSYATVLDYFNMGRAFATDFELAFFLSNPNVKVS